MSRHSTINIMDSNLSTTPPSIQIISWVFPMLSDENWPNPLWQRSPHKTTQPNLTDSSHHIIVFCYPNPRVSTPPLIRIHHRPFLFPARALIIMIAHATISNPTIPPPQLTLSQFSNSLQFVHTLISLKCRNNSYP